jgi:16S rRNA (guanine527-N7)-methyltransferase
LLLSLAEPFMRTGATALFHKGQDVDTELNEAAKSWRMMYKKHPSETDSLSVILEVKELARVQP